MNLFLTKIMVLTLFYWFIEPVEKKPKCVAKSTKKTTKKGEF